MKTKNKTYQDSLKETLDELDKRWYLWDKKDGDSPETFTTCGEEVKEFITQAIDKHIELERERIAEIVKFQIENNLEGNILPLIKIKKANSYLEE